MDRIPIKSDAKMFDLAVSKIQTALANSLSWLNHSCGICEKLTDTKDGKKFDSANIYVGEGRYEQVMPCEELGNFSFFILRDPQTIVNKNKKLISSPFSLVIWYKVDDVSNSPSSRNREAIKGQILGVLNGMHSPFFTIGKVYEDAKNIFSDFSYDYTKNQFLMHPYGGLRIDGTIIAQTPCVSGVAETFYLLEKNGKYLIDRNGNKLVYKH